MGKRAVVEQKKRKPRKIKDKNAPKKPRSAFMFFSQARRLTLKEEQPNLTIIDASKVIGNEWKHLTDEDKEKYVESA